MRIRDGSVSIRLLPVLVDRHLVVTVPVVLGPKVLCLAMSKHRPLDLDTEFKKAIESYILSCLGDNLNRFASLSVPLHSI